MFRKSLGILLIMALTMSLVPVTTHAIIPVAVDADIPSIIHWAQRFQRWAQREAVVLHTYHEIVAKYEWAKTVATNIKNGDALTLLAVVTGVASQNLTQVDNFQDLRKMLDGTQAYSNQMSSMYHSVYGQAVSLGNLHPMGAEDWASAAERYINMSQQADAAILETYAVSSNTNNYSRQNVSKYNLLMANIKADGTLPEQTAQHQAIASIYTAQAVERNNQLLATMAALQAQHQAQICAEQKQAIERQYTEQQYMESCSQSLAGELQHVQSWEMH